MNYRVATFVVVVFLALTALPSSAQDFTGTINGRISDTTGATVPGVAVTLSSSAIQGVREAISGETGAYQFQFLPPGTYTLKFELSGFKTLIREGLIVEVQRTTTINAQLEVSSLSETVTVTGESPVVDTQNATVAVNFTQTLLRDMPNSRDIWIVLAQTPGITTTRYDVGGSTMGTQTAFRAYGTSGQNWYTLDGVVTTNGPNSAGWYFDYGAFQEMQVSAAANAAEVPVPGAFLNTVIKTGSNELHGMAYVDWEDDSFQGKNLSPEFSRPCVATGQTGPCGLFVGDKFITYNDINLNLGGPIKKDKLWFFVSWRNQFSDLATELKLNNGQPGGHYSTVLRNPTFKFNLQLTPKDSLSAMVQMSRKLAPYRGGQGANASFFVEDSTGNQKDPSLGYKVQWVRVLNSRATLDVSANSSGYTFPLYSRTKEMARRDLVTQEVRGSYSGQGVGLTTNQPAVSSPGHYNWKATNSYYKDNFLGGDHNFKFGYDVFWEVSRTFNLGPEGQLVAYYRSGVPDQMQTYNGPFHTKNAVLHNAFFAQDKWQIGHLTLNIGMRFDRYSSYIPSQENEGIGPFAERLSVAKTNLNSFNNPVPRFSFAYDLGGRGKTALKASYGRFAWNPSFQITADANPNTVITRRYRWNGTLPFIPSAANLLSTTGGRTRAIDPNLKNAYTDEYTAGIDQELFTDFSVRFNFVRKIEHNLRGTVNTEQNTSQYLPVNFVDPGPDNVRGNADDRNLTVFSVAPGAVGRISELVRTFDGVGSNYSTWELQAVKRMSNRWQIITGVDWTKRNVAQNLTLDPNDFIYGLGTPSGGHYWEWSYKLMGQYELPRGFKFASVYKAQRGETYSRRLNVTGLNQGTITIQTAPLGSTFYPDVHLWDLRLEKKFQVKETQAIDAMFDLFNITNRNTVLGFDTLTGATFGRRITQTLNPRIFRLGVRYTF